MPTSETVDVKERSSTFTEDGRLLLSLPNILMDVGDLTVRVGVVGQPASDRKLTVGEAFIYSPAPDIRFEVRLLELCRPNAVFLVTPMTTVSE